MQSTPTPAANAADQAEQSWLSDSWDANRMVLSEWGLALAGAVVLLGYELAFHPPFSAPVSEHAGQLWSILAQLAPSYLEGMGALAGVVALPVTFFIAVALSDAGVIGTRWTQETRARAAQLLRWSSRAVPVLSWFFIPTLISLSTPILGVIGPLGVQLLCAYTAALAVTERTSAASYESITAELTQLEVRREALVGKLGQWPTPWPWWRRLSQSSAQMVTLGTAMVLVVSAMAIVGGGTSGGFLRGLAIYTGVALVLVALLSVGVGSIATTTRTRSAWTQVATAIVIVPIVVLTLNLISNSNTSAVAVNGWTLLPLLPVLGIEAWVILFTDKRDLFVPPRIAALDRQIRRLGRSQRAAKDLMEAHQAT